MDENTKKRINKYFYTLEDLKWHLHKVYPLQEYVNFGYGISSKIPEVLGKVEMKIPTHSPFYTFGHLKCRF